MGSAEVSNPHPVHAAAGSFSDVERVGVERAGPEPQELRQRSRAAWPLGEAPAQESLPHATRQSARGGHRRGGRVPCALARTRSTAWFSSGCSRLCRAR
jgi:hypothetical protein